MGTSNLLEMHACNPQAMPSDFKPTFQVNQLCPCYSYYVKLLLRQIALMPVSMHWVPYVYMPEILIMVMQQAML